MMKGIPLPIVTLSEAKGLCCSENRRKRQRFFALLRMTPFRKEVCGCGLGVLLACAVHAQVIVEQGQSKTVRIGEQGRLVYATDAKGNRLPDFSYVGYHSGEKPIPNMPVKMTLEPVPGDNTAAIQKAIDKVGCGAILLKRGVYRVEGVLRINTSGIVLRGEDATIVAAGYGDAKYKRTLITVGNGDRLKVKPATKRVITDDYVPVGAQTFTVASAEGYRVGDRIAVYRPGTAKWIRSIGCDTIKTMPWTEGDYDFYFERTITGLEGNRVTIDAPVVQALDKEFGGGAIFQYETPGRVTEVGIENLRLISEFAAPVPGSPYGDPKETGKSELHAWNAIKLNRNTENTWVRNVTGNYFGWSVVSASGTRATVQDCVSLGHASQITGGRRYPFMIDGQLNLVQRCVTFAGRHEFVTQARTAGPNVFVDCIGYDSKSSAGPHHRYSVGTLFDNVKSEREMESRFRGNSGTGHGWAGAQTCFYNCVAPKFAVQAPPGGMSWVLTGVAPPSLYYRQVEERLGKKALEYLTIPGQLENMGRYLWVKKYE